MLRHVQSSLGELVDAVLPLSARDALAARLANDPPALAQSGFTGVAARVDEAFLAHARELKRASALAALGRFLHGARVEADTSDPRLDRDLAALEDARAALETTREHLRSALAAERVALRARIDQALRAAALELRDVIRPRAWPFGEHSAEPGDERFLVDVLDDAVARAVERTRQALREALAPPGRASVTEDDPGERGPRSGRRPRRGR